MITKEEVLKAFDIIEQYQIQEKNKIQQIDVDSDQRSILLLGLKTRELNCLIAKGIDTIGKLLKVGVLELRSFRNIGVTGVEDINKKLKAIGIEKEFIVGKK